MLIAVALVVWAGITWASWWQRICAYQILAYPVLKLVEARTTTNFFIHTNKKKKKPTKEVILLLKDLMANHIIVNLVIKILSQLYQLLTYEYKIDLSRQRVFGLCFQTTIFSF